MIGAAFAPPLRDDDLAAYDADAVPGYVRFFDAQAAGMLIPRDAARVACFGCRTGAAQTEVAARLSSGDALVGIDTSEPAIWAARLRDGAPGLSVAFEHSAGMPTSLDDESVTHAVAIHPLGAPHQRAELFAEMRRVLAPGGQLVVTMPLRGSFPELGDLVREFALKHDKPNVAAAVDRAAQMRVSIETLASDLEMAGFVNVDVDVQLLAVPFETGKVYARSAVSRLVIEPDLSQLLDVDGPMRSRAMAYASDAVGRYWSESSFELAVNLGGASAFAPGMAVRRSTIPPPLR
jgi:SAM-dependent methyltransferase